MNFFKKIPLIILTISLNGIVAQEVKFGEVTKEELSEKEYSLYPEAEAAVLYRNRNTYFTSNNGNNQLITEIHERIKIYNKGGFTYATEYINLYHGKLDKEKVRKIKASTYNLNGDKIEISELDKDQIFESKIGYNYNQVKFTMPNVKEGSIIEFQYKVISPFIWNIDEFRFQADIPIKLIEATLNTPKGFNFRQTQKGYLPFSTKETTKHDNRLSMDVLVTSFKLKDVPALKEEQYVDNIDNYKAGALFELVSIDVPGTLFKSYARDWADVAKTIGSSTDYKNELDKNRFFDDELDALLIGKNDDEQRTEIVFDYVKKNIQWNGVDGIYFQNGLKNTLKEKKGNAADINLSLVSMLRYAGIKANPIILSTKDNAIPFFPTLDRMNYVIAYAEINGKDYYMDATEEFSDINLLPIKDYNWGGLLIDNKNQVWKHINAIVPKKATNIYAVNMNLNIEGSLSGDYHSRLTNHAAYRFRKNYKKMDTEKHLSERENRLSGIEISDYSAKNANTYDGHVSESFRYKYENAADVIGDKIYLRPLAFLAMHENPFKTEKREYPIDFGYPFKDKYIVNITLPEGYSVKSIPSPALLKLPNGLGEFKYVIKNTVDSIQLSVTFDMNKAFVSALSYPDIKEFFNQIIVKETEQIVLQQISDGHNQSATGSR